MMGRQLGLNLLLLVLVQFFHVTLCCRNGGSLTGQFPISFLNMNAGPTLTSPCNDDRQTDGYSGCGSPMSQMIWGTPGFAPAACSPVPGQSSWLTAGILPTVFSCDQEIQIGYLSHSNMLIHENPQASATLHLQVRINGLQPIDYFWNIVHFETTNWFLSNSCPDAGGGNCCGEACGTSSCSSCGAFATFCPFGGDPCGAGCYDAIGFTQAYPLSNTRTATPIGGHPDIDPGCTYTVSVRWDVQPTSQTIAGVALHGIFITPEGQTTTRPVLLVVRKTCAPTSPPTGPPSSPPPSGTPETTTQPPPTEPPTSQPPVTQVPCVEFCSSVGPCAFCIDQFLCSPGPTCNKCQMCAGGTGACIPDPSKACSSQCEICDPGSGGCVFDTSKTCGDRCMQCNPASGACDQPTAVAQACDQCSACDPASGICSPVPAKVNCANKCMRCNPANGQCDTPTAVAQSCDLCHVCNPATGQCDPIPEKVNCADRCMQCNGATGKCDLPTAVAAGCDKCQQCNSTTGQCVDDPRKISACSGDKCTICDRVNGGCKPDEAKVNCADKCTKCNPANGICDTQTGACDNNKCFSCLPSSGLCQTRRNLTCFAPNQCMECDNALGCVPTAVAKSCTSCQFCDDVIGCRANTSLCATDLCFDCNPTDNAQCTRPRDQRCFDDLCLKCNASTGVCNEPRNLTCVANKCYRCDNTNGQCVIKSEIQCSPCQICDPTSGDCIDAGLCDKCQDCTVTGNSTYQCRDKVNVCPVCTRCVRSLGSCEPLRCGTCAACDNTTNTCQITPSVPCGDTPECQFCDASGFCISQVNRTCTLPDNDSCRNPYCDATGQCVLSTDLSAVGTSCGTVTDCMQHFCDASGSCVDAPVATNRSCSLPTGSSECQQAACTGQGECKAVPLNGIACSLNASVKANRTLAMCHSAVCQSGQCITVPLVDGFNCTYRRNESDLEEKICMFSICSNGVCVENMTVPSCQRRRGSRGKIGIILGATAGGVLLLGAVIIAFFARGSGASPKPHAFGVDMIDSSLLQNPLFANANIEYKNIMYNEDS